MTARHANELLYDSEAALRLVDSAIEDIREPDPRRGAERASYHAKLREVSTATETAATNILNGLDRAVALVDAMDAKASVGDVEGGAELRNKLRDELFALMGCMQFQDITTQQLNYASSVLAEMETRLADLARILNPAAFGAPTALAPAVPTTASGPANFDPSASTQNAEARQAVADQIFRRDQS